MLEKLIISITKSNLDKSLVKDIHIVIVDNDAKRSAEKKVEELKMQQKDIYKLQYHTYPVKGLSNVRNELIRKALLLNPDFIVFIDDDEFVTTEWLNELIKTLLNNNGDIVSGPVLPVFNHKVSKSISCWFNRPNFQNNQRINSIASGNLIMSVDSLQKYNVWFDPRFNVTGSEDSYFGFQVLKKGAKIFWAKKGIAYETIPSNRTNLKWLIKRRYRGASNFTYILKLEKKYLQIVKKIITSIINIVAGLIGIILLWPFTIRYWGYLKISEGFGAFVGLANIRYKEYK
jgi:GT2 family glycosyltransferase